MNKIFVSSDYHFFHDREFIYKPRGFNSIEEMNQTILDNHNKIIDLDDDVYLLGDLLLGGPNKLDEGLELISKLNGRLHLVRGNHCTDKRWAAFRECSNVVEQQNAIYLKYEGYYFFMTHFPTITSNNDYDKPLKARVLNLCGHSHIQDPWLDKDKGYIYHCELDAHNNMPVSIDYIIEEFKKIY